MFSVLPNHIGEGDSSKRTSYFLYTQCSVKDRDGSKMQKARELGIGWKIGRERREKDVDRLLEKKD